MLGVIDLSVKYGPIHAVRGVSLTVERGEIVTIIGANGAGKSTVLKTIVGLLRPDGGDIRLDGEGLALATPAAIVQRGIALVPEGRRVFPRLSVLDNLLLGAYGKPRAAIEAGLAQVYELFPRLRERRRQTAGTLSGGEQQMLAMGRGLMSAPRLLLLDEPSMGLAPLLVQQIFETILTINERGTTILLVEQNAHMALAVADRGYVLEAGAVALTAGAEELSNDPQVRRAYLGD